MVDLKSFAGSMDDSIPLKDKVLNVMAHDFSQMFCLFDPGYVLHYTRDDDGIINRFEIENLLELESVYCMLFRQEQMDHGIEPNISVRKCSSIIVAVYRHCNDIFRFKKHERYSVETIRNFYKVHVDIIWPSLYDELLSKGDKAKLGKEEEPFG